MRGTVLVIAIMLAWTAAAALIGYLARPKSESDPYANPFGDVPGRGR